MVGNLVQGVKKLPSMPDPVVQHKAEPVITQAKRKKTRNNVLQFRIMFVGLAFAVVSSIALIFLATPALVKQLILADSEHLSVEWIQEVQTTRELPGTAPSSYMGFLSVLHDYFLQNETAGHSPNFDLLNPKNFNKGERFAQLRGYRIFKNLGDELLSGGSLNGRYYSSRVHTNHFFTSWKSKSTLTAERKIVGDAGHGIVTVYIPLIDGFDVKGMAVVDVEKSGLEIAMQKALERGALLLAAVISFGAFLFLLLLKSFAQRRDDAENEVHFLAYRDPLTRLPNRRSFQEKLPDWITKVSNQHGGGLICIDVDRFKDVNDFHGHPIGDRLLVEISRRLKSAAGDNRVFRLSGDEFTILVTNKPGEDTVSKVAAALSDSCNRTLKFDGALVDNNMSIGAALCPDHSDEPSQLLRYADLALYEAKETGRGKNVFFNPDLYRRLRRKSFVLDQLNKAISAETLVTLYQPQVNTKAGTIVGCEALVRLPQVNDDFISPAEFIPLAETNGLITALGEQVLRKACQEATEWTNGEHIAVNVSPVQFKKGDLPALVAQVLNETGLAAERLELEITEGVFVQDEEGVLDQLHALRKLGVGLAMDDFGTGFSSLNYLTRLPLTKIKIDRSFVIKMLDDEVAATIIKAVIHIGDAMNAVVIAEGIEEHEQAAFLSQLGCDHLQGYLFGRPAENPFEVDSPVKLQVEELGRRLAG